LNIDFLAPVDAIKESMHRTRDGKDTISCTGNVLRDYLTDLFPIIELGSSAKMLSIVPLLNGGVLLETGAGGSAPKHVEQFVEENHLRWDSLGEYLATAISFQELGARTNNTKATLLGDTLMNAVGRWLDEVRTPGRKVKQMDNRGSSYYVASYWAQEMAQHDVSFKSLANALIANETQIVKELIDCQGNSVDIGGYYKPDPAKVDKAMRPCQLLNEIIEKN
jgi:isocitrate dehydrogenase